MLNQSLKESKSVCICAKIIHEYSSFRYIRVSACIIYSFSDIYVCMLMYIYVYIYVPFSYNINEICTQT